MSTTPKSPAEALTELTTAVNAVIMKLDAAALRTGRIEQKIEALPTSPQPSENSETQDPISALKDQLTQDTRAQNTVLAELARSVAQIQTRVNEKPAPRSPVPADLSPTVLAEMKTAVAEAARAAVTAGRRVGGGNSGGNADRVAAAIAERLAPAPVRPRILAAVAVGLLVVVMLAVVGLARVQHLAGEWAWSRPWWWFAALLAVSGYALVAVGVYVIAVAAARHLARWWSTKPTQRLLAALTRYEIRK